MSMIDFDSRSFDELLFDDGFLPSLLPSCHEQVAEEVKEVESEPNHVAIPLIDEVAGGASSLSIPQGSKNELP